MADVVVRLTWAETMQAANVGVMRLVQNMKLGRQDKHGCQADSNWLTHIEGACGEMAAAKLFKSYWSGAVGHLEADDVGCLQIRTRSRHHYELILHKDDPDERAFVLLTGIAPEYRVRGWIIARDGKLEEFWKDPAGGRPAYFVPHDKLRPIADLIQRGGRDVAA